MYILHPKQLSIRHTTREEYKNVYKKSYWCRWNKNYATKFVKYSAGIEVGSSPAVVYKNFIRILFNWKNCKLRPKKNFVSGPREYEHSGYSGYFGWSVFR